MNKLLFKRIDFWSQTALISVLLVSTILFLLGFSNSISFTTFFGIGFWQVCSAIINFFKIKIQNKNRKSWQITSILLLFLIIISILSFIPLYNNKNILFGFVVICLYFALFFSPILVIWYLVITWLELKEMEKVEKIEKVKP